MNHFPEENLILRLANKEDEKLLLDWSNDPIVRQWSFNNSKPIEITEHQKWFKNKLQNKDVRIWIMEKQHLPCGQVRIEKSENQAILHYLISSDFRGNSLGSKMVRMAVQKTFDEWPGIQILAYTFPKNIASIRSLIKVGFTEKSSSSKRKCFIL